MTDNKQTVLIIEDDLDVAEMLNAYFRVQGYEVLTADWGADGVEVAQSALPQIIILDIRLPDIDGFEVASRLRANHRTRQIPIIFLTEKRQRLDRIKGLELGADDYITKPFDIQELKLRVRNALRRASQGPLTNPVTDLPEGELVNEQLEILLEPPVNQALTLIRVENLETFRESFGFVASDDVLRAIRLIIRQIVDEHGDPDRFLGHLAAGEFIAITTSSQAARLHEQIDKQISGAIELFYPVSVREGSVPIDKPLSIRTATLDLDEVGTAGDREALLKKLVESIA